MSSFGDRCAESAVAFKGPAAVAMIKLSIAAAQTIVLVDSMEVEESKLVFEVPAENLGSRRGSRPKLVLI